VITVEKGAFSEKISRGYCRRVNRLVKRTLLGTIVTLLSLLSSTRPPVQAQARTLMISSPAADGATVSGVYTFTVDAVTSAPTTATVEYKMGSVTLGVATASPFSFSWNTGYGNDGNHDLQAIARDASGVIVATGTRIFNSQNHGVSMVINSPDITQPLSGTISLSMLASDTAYYPRIFVRFIDGRHAGYWDTGSSPNQHTVTASFSLDTRQFSNGTHELAIHMTAVKNATGPDVYINYEGDLNRTKVEFYVGGSQTCTSAVAPYNCNWKVPAAANKSYTLQTKAYDAAGNIGTSPPVTVTSK
jgi:Bacterial Ig domain